MNVKISFFGVLGYFQRLILNKLLNNVKAIEVYDGRDRLQIIYFDKSSRVIATILSYAPQSFRVIVNQYTEQSSPEANHYLYEVTQPQ